METVERLKSPCDSIIVTSFFVLFLNDRRLGSTMPFMGSYPCHPGRADVFLEAAITSRSLHGLQAVCLWRRCVEACGEGTDAT